MTLNHRYNPPKLRRLSQTFDFFRLIYLDLFIVLINNRNTTLLLLYFLSIFGVMIGELDPISIRLRLRLIWHLHGINCIHSL